MFSPKVLETDLNKSWSQKIDMDWDYKDFYVLSAYPSIEFWGNHWKAQLQLLVQSQFDH